MFPRFKKKKDKQKSETRMTAGDKHRTSKQQNLTAEPKAEKCPTSHFSPFNCCLSVVL